ncbi:MAG: Holliday junction branch migration protein RuvA [bacterium]
MIAYLKGKLVELLPDRVIIEVAGIGYNVYMPSSAYSRLPGAEEEVMVYIRFHVRDDAFVLFGFVTVAEREIFDLLLTIPGIGPRVAINVLSVMAPAQLQRAIGSEDADSLMRIPGIGKKTAQRIILELKEKINKLLLTGAATEGDLPAADTSLAEAAAALAVLGYGAAEINRALRTVGDDASALPPTGELVRLALEYLRGN